MEPAETGRRYDAIAAEWDDRLASSLSYLRRAVALCANQGVALDVGCGGGRMVVALDEEYLRVLNERGCKCVLLVRDQHPEDHLVVIGVKN